MKIGVSTLGTDSGRSGIGQYTRSFIEGVHPIDDTSGSLSIHATSSDLKAYQFENLDFQIHLESNLLENPLLGISWCLHTFPKLAAKFEYDVVFMPAGNRRLPYSMPCPTVGTVHDLSALHVPGKYDAFRGFYIKTVLPFLIRQLTHVITISESSKKDIMAHCGVPDDRITVIPLAHNKKQFHKHIGGDEVSRVRQKFCLQKPYILYTSRLESPGKNHIRLIEAFSSLRKHTSIPHQLVFAGSPWSRAKDIYDAAALSPFSSDILFLDFVPQRDLPALYSAAEAFVFPSLYEGFGLPVLEAMACGTPVLSSNISSLPEVGGSAVRYFNPLSVTDMSCALNDVLFNPAERRFLVEEGLTQSSQFSWQKTVAETLDVLYRVSTKHESTISSQAA